MKITLISPLDDIVGEIKNQARDGEQYISGLSSGNQFANNILMLFYRGHAKNGASKIYKYT